MKRHDYTKYFVVGKRLTTGEEYTHLNDNHPESLDKLVLDIHKMFDAGPDDWIYSVILEAFEALEEDEIDNITIEADCYNNQLFKWLLENGNRYATVLIEEAMESGLCEPNDLISAISCGQWLAMDNIYHAVNDFIEQNRDESGEEE